MFDRYCIQKNYTSLEVLIHLAIMEESSAILWHCQDSEDGVYDSIWVDRLDSASIDRAMTFMFRILFF